MAQRYSDAIRIRETKSAYNIQTEEFEEWKNFIPNEQFNEILQKVIVSVNNKVIDEHRSFWLEGTYGTGKSHAAAVIKHLLCDPFGAIEEYIKDEFSGDKYELLRESLISLRGKKRLFPVTMYGHCSIAHKDDLSLQIQSHVVKALDDAGISITVRTDFDNYISNIEKNPLIWDTIISQNSELASYAPDRKKLIKDLSDADSSVLSLMKNALRTSGFHVRLEQENLCKWFFEVQDELAKKTEYNGIFLIWDEFTDVMLSDIGPSLLVDLQELAEATMQQQNNSYFFHIAHPSALDNLKAEDRTKTTGRYKFMHYNMEPVSAFKIMSRKFKLNEENQSATLAYFNMTAHYFAQMQEVYLKYAQTSNNPTETLSDLKKLFPVHPATANLATYYAREAGSSSRSVFEFLGSNQAIREFLDSEDHFKNKDMITADYLWDFVLDEFNSKVTKYGVVTERYNSYKLHVQNMGDAYSAVFKGILLLNALNNLANNETVTPSEENIKNLFVGTPIDEEIDDILNWFNTQGVVQRSPQGVYEIRFSALDAKEIEDFKETLINNDFKRTSQIIKFGDTATKEFDKSLKGVFRPCVYEFFSEDSNEYTLLNNIERSYKSVQSYELFAALFVARSSQELALLKDIASRNSVDERFKNIVFFVFDSILSQLDYERFIEYQANASCASKHGYDEQTKSHRENAKAIIYDWTKTIKSGVCTIFMKGKTENFPSRQLATFINSSVSPVIFNHGPESLELIRLRAPQTCWAKQHTKGTGDNILSFSTKDEIVERSTGPAKIVTQMLQDSVDDNLKFKQDVDVNHPLVIVSNFVKSRIDRSDKQNTFNIAEKLEDLAKPPYGLYPSHSGYALLAFALKPYVDKVFDTTGKPIGAQRMVEIVNETFKIWDGSGSTQKVNVKFETKEEGAIAKGLIKLFNLNNLKDYKDVSSLTDSRWAIRNGYCQEVGYPLWTLKYCDMMQSIPSKDKICILIDNIIAIYSEAGIKNPKLMVDTDSLLTECTFELKTLLPKSIINNFDIGFKNFLKKDSVVNLADELYPDACEYIKQHMEQGVGLWTEEAVLVQLKDWAIKENNKIRQQEEAERLRKEQEQKEREEENRRILEELAAKEKEEEIISKKTVAIDKVKNMDSLEDVKEILERICEFGYEDILNLILK